MPTKENKLSRAEQAHQILKRQILENKVLPGTMLGEVALTRELNMSRTPIREALKMLKSEDLVEIRDGVGTFVKTVTKKDIRDAYAVRQVLEILAARTAIDEFTDEELDELEETFRSIQTRLARGEAVSVEEFADSDWKLHDQLIQKSGNRYAQQVAQTLETVMRRYQYLSVKLFSHVENSLEEHLEIVKSIRDKDLDKLTALLEHHIQY